MQHAFVYRNGTLKDLGALAGGYSEGLAINSAGDIVGGSANSTGFPVAFVYSHGVMQDLDGLIDATDPLQPSVLLIAATAIADNGFIAADGYDINTKHYHAYLLSPHASRE